MTPEQWTRVEALFGAALDRPASERTAWLAGACPEAEVRDEVLALLAAAPSAGFLEDPAAVVAADLMLDPASDDRPGPEVGARLGAYRLVRELGRGGMGVVYLAERADGQFDQRVAIKLLRRDLRSAAFHDRFLAERQILATLDHPHIARLLDGGLTAEGRPFYAMVYVEGRPITRYCDEERLGVAARLRLFGQICEAVAYAHRALVVHCDIKPSNVLVTAGGRVKLLDFGIAKLLSAAEPEARTEAPPLTLAYAAPEQIRGEPVSTATDVYALGVLLYEMLSGQRPFDAATSARGRRRQAILDETPLAPSTALASPAPEAERQAVADARQTDPARLRRRLRGDLDRIVGQALRKKPERRYPSAEALGRDVARHLAGLPVDARPATLGNRLGAFVRRHRVGVALTALGVLAVAVLGTFHVRQVTAERDRAEAAAQRAEQISTFLTDLITRADDPRTDRLVLLNLLEPALADAERDLAADPEARAAVYHTLGNLYAHLGRGDLANSLLARALALRRAIYDPPHEALASAHYDYGVQLLGARRDSALTHVRASAEMRRALTRGDHTDLAWSLLQWARFLPTGHPDKRPRFEEALEMLRRLHGPRSPEVASALHEFYALGFGSDDQAEIERGFREVVDIYQEAGWEGHPHAINAMHNLALVLDARDAREESLQFFNRALRAGRRSLPEGNHAFVTLQVNYGATLHEHGRFTEADRVLRNVAEETRRVFGDSVSGVAHSHYWYGRNLLALDRPADAETALRLSLDVSRVQGATGPFVDRVRLEWAEALRRLGDRRAEPVLREAAARLQDTPFEGLARDRLDAFGGAPGDGGSHLGAGEPR